MEITMTHRDGPSVFVTIKMDKVYLHNPCVISLS